MIDLLAKLTTLADLLRTQDSRCTDLPVYVVQQRERVYGFDPNYCDQTVFVHCDGDEADAEETARFRALSDSFEDIPDDWTETGFQDRWDFVTACLTEEAANAYIRVNGHNLNSPRIYVESGYRNAEWEMLRELPALVLAEIQRLTAERDAAHGDLAEVDMVLGIVGADRECRRMLLCANRDRTLSAEREVARFTALVAESEGA